MEFIWYYLGISCIRDAMEIVPVQIPKLVFHRLLCIYGMVVRGCSLALNSAPSNRRIDLAACRRIMLYRGRHFLCTGSRAITPEGIWLP